MRGDIRANSWQGVVGSEEGEEESELNSRFLRLQFSVVTPFYWMGIFVQVATSESGCHSLPGVSTAVLEHSVSLPFEVGKGLM
jgi:hypothetical protein